MKHNTITDALQTYQTGRRTPEIPQLSNICVAEIPVQSSPSSFARTVYIVEFKIGTKYSISDGLKQKEINEIKECNRNRFAAEVHHEMYKDFHSELMMLREHIYSGDYREAEQKILEMLSFCRG